MNGLEDLSDRTAEAQKSPALATKSGTTKPGPGKAKLDPISPHMMCAILISEAWTRPEPSPKNRRLAKAAEAYWRAIGGDGRHSGKDPLAFWRRHFKKAANLTAKEFRVEWKAPPP